MMTNRTGASDCRTGSPNSPFPRNVSQIAGTASYPGNGSVRDFTFVDDTGSQSMAGKRDG